MLTVTEQANAFTPNWGQIIFQSANEINQNRLLKEKVAELEEKTEAEKAWWDKKRAGISSSFMKELEESQTKAEGQDDAVLVEAGGPGSTQGGGKKKGKK